MIWNLFWAAVTLILAIHCFSDMGWFSMHGHKKATVFAFAAALFYAGASLGHCVLAYNKLGVWP